MSDNVVFPKSEDVSKLVNSAKILVNDANVLDILSTYASNCSKQIHYFCIDSAIQEKKKSIDFLSSLPEPIEMGFMDETSDLIPKKAFTNEKSSSKLDSQQVLETSYPVISIAKSWSNNYLLAGSLNNVFYFPYDSFLYKQVSTSSLVQNENEDLIPNLQSSQLSTTVYPPGDQMAFCRNVCFHPSDALCGITRENSVYLYDISSYVETDYEDGGEENNQKQVLSLVSSLKNVHQSCITGLVFSPDGSHFVTSSLDRTIKTYDLIRSETIYSINIKKQATYLDSSFDGQFIGLTTDSGSLILFDDRQEGSTTNIQAHKHWASTLSFSNYSPLIVTAGSDKSIAVFDIRQPLSTVFRLFKHRGTPISTCFDNNDHVWSSTTAGELQAWNLSDARNVFELNLGESDNNEESQSNSVYKIVFNEFNNTLLCSIGNGQLRLMNLNDDIFSSEAKTVFNFL